MKPEPLEIYTAKMRLRECQDLRPCVIIYVGAGRSVEVLPVSGQLQMKDDYLSFGIEKDHPDFFATGLTRTSYVVDGGMQMLQTDDLMKRLGHLEGDLARDFKKWFGL